MTADTAVFSPVERCWVCRHKGFGRFHELAFDLSAFERQDPELAAYTGARLWLQRCRRCGFAQPEALPALDRYFERMYDQQWSEDWIASEFDSRSKDPIFLGILRDLRRRVSPGRLLDVGAHVGKFVALAASQP